MTAPSHIGDELGQGRSSSRYPLVELAGRATIQSGFPFKSSTWRESGIPVVKIANVKQGRVDREGLGYVDELTAGEAKAFALAQGDVLIAMTGYVGEAAMVSESDLPLLLNQRVGRCNIVSADLDLEFLYFALTSPSGRKQLENLAQGSAQPNLSTKDFGLVEIPLPPLPEQRAIAEVLGALDDKIESNRRVVRSSDALIEAEFLRSTRGAEFVPMDPWVKVQMGSAFKGEYFSEPPAGRPLIRIRDLKTFEPQVSTTEVRPDEIVVQPGDVVVGMDAEFRSTLWQGQPGVLNQRMCRFISGDGVSRAFTYQAIRKDLSFFEGAKSGTTVIHLNKADIDRFRVPELSPVQHDALKKTTDLLLDRLIVAAGESRVLSQLRDTLLPALLSGRIRVPAAAELVEAS